MRCRQLSSCCSSCCEYRQSADSCHCEPQGGLCTAAYDIGRCRQYEQQPCGYPVAVSDYEHCHERRCRSYHHDRPCDAHTVLAVCACHCNIHIYPAFKYSCLTDGSVRYKGDSIPDIKYLYRGDCQYNCDVSASCNDPFPAAEAPDDVQHNRRCSCRCCYHDPSGVSFRQRTYTACEGCCICSGYQYIRQQFPCMPGPACIFIISERKNNGTVFFFSHKCSSVICLYHEVHVCDPAECM